MDGLRDLSIERFGTDGWLFATHRTVPGLTLFAPTLDEIKSRLPGALALVLNARLKDMEAELDAYSIVLADLRAKRAQIDSAIAAIEALSGLNSSQAQSAFQDPSAGRNGQLTPGMFHGMSIVDAVKQLLAMRKKPMGTGEITADLQEGGVVFSTETPGNTVGSVLHRESSKAVGAGILSVGRGTWALPAWYSNPGRFQKKKAASDEAPKDDQETAIPMPDSSAAT